MIVAMDTFNGIGKNGTLPWNIPEDLKHFSEITRKTEGEGGKNMVVMGRKTWDSIPLIKRPLKGRVNVVLTTQDLKNTPQYQNIEGQLYFVSRTDSIPTIAMTCGVEKIFIIGGTSVYEAFASQVNKVYVTRVHGDFHCDAYFPSTISPKSISDCECHENYRFETWYLNDAFEQKENVVEKRKEGVKTDMKDDMKVDMNETARDEQGYFNPHDAEYARVLRHVLQNGKKRSDRTGTGTISVFAPDPMRFDISESVPLLTTKKMAWKGIIKELLWFLRGDTDAKILQKQGVRIWDGNTSREFLDKVGLQYEEGIIGAGYGWQFRRFGAPYDQKFADSKNITPEDSKRLGGFDQIAYVDRLLEEDPFSRRIYINLWNANDIDKMALTPCHLGINMYVEEDKVGKRHLSAHIYIRSNDLFLGNPYNIFSYAVFVYIMAKRHDMSPKDLVISFGDAHIYSDHIEQVKEQLDRYSYPAPRLTLSDRIKDISFEEMDVQDFILNDYVSHPAIKAKMSA